MFAIQTANTLLGIYSGRELFVVPFAVPFTTLLTVPFTFLFVIPFTVFFTIVVLPWFVRIVRIGANFRVG